MRKQHLTDKGDPSKDEWSLAWSSAGQQNDGSERHNDLEITEVSSFEIACLLKLPAADISNQRFRGLSWQCSLFASNNLLEPIIGCTSFRYDPGRHSVGSHFSCTILIRVRCVIQ